MEEEIEIARSQSYEAVSAAAKSIREMGGTASIYFGRPAVGHLAEYSIRASGLTPELLHEHRLMVERRTLWEI